SVVAVSITKNRFWVISKALPLFEHLLELAEKDIFLEAAEPIDHQNAVDVVDFVLDKPGEQPLPFEADLLPLPVKPLQLNPQRPFDIFVIAGKREATLFRDLLPLHRDNLRID